MHNWWTTSPNWGRHAVALGTSCGQRESSKVLGSQALCSPSQPTKHPSARRNDEPPGEQSPEPRGTGRPAHCRGSDGSRWSSERRSEPVRKSWHWTRSGVAQDGDGRQRERRGRGNPTATVAKVTGTAPRGIGSPDRAPARAAGTGVQPGLEGQDPPSARKDVRQVWGTGTVTRPPASPSCRGPRPMLGQVLALRQLRHAGARLGR